MRPINSLKLHNFRGFSGEHTVDLDADLVLVTGKNGTGKTSLLLAIDLLLNGPTSLIQNTADLKTSTATSGRLELMGHSPLQVDLSSLPARRAYADLLERAQFFFPEGLVSPENSQDILSIVAPTATAWQSIRGALEDAQFELTTAKTAIFVQRFDVERERRTVAQRFEQAKSKFSLEDALDFPWVATVLDSQSLLIQSGNLANYWQSQLRNLLDKLAEVAGLDTPIATATETDRVLDSIGQACEALRSKVESSKPVDAYGHAPVDALRRTLGNVDSDWEIDWSELFGPKAQDEISKASEIEKQFAENQQRLSVIREQRSRLEVGSNALAPSLEQIGEQAEGWLESLRGLPESMRDEGAQLESWLGDLLISAPSLAAQARAIAEKLRQSELEKLSEVALAEATIKEIHNRQTLRSYISPVKDEEWAYTAATVGELLERAENRATEHRQTRSSLDRVTVALGELATAARSWANLEREIERQSLAIGSKEKRVEAERLIIEAERTLKRATGKDSVFSMTSAIDEAQLRELLRSLNRLLARFHFPSDFLPIQLQIVSKSAKVPNYRFVSARGPEYAGLSTGQKTQLAVCWTVCLSYALRDRITHPIVAFDDFTTALDMGQLIPASGILRQLAYCESDEYRRQVIVTSHHEDLTNRLLDYLLPPKGRTMKVIEMLEWTPESGPEMQVYDVKPAVQQASPVELAGWLNAQLQGRPA
ncbi:AAA family ATPase [Paraburkholderia nodosa]|uniref:AAA family ATPase n=1 Tax=Paraburkholderia nodosa TaxID=392320 RepID=UPI0004B725BD|nr:AAA family ATPase [Paraburkholderia nodosa]